MRATWLVDVDQACANREIGERQAEQGKDGETLDCRVWHDANSGFDGLVHPRMILHLTTHSPLNQASRGRWEAR